MSTKTSKRAEAPTKLGLSAAVEAFLGLAMTHPEKEPRTQRQARDNEMQIIGFNKAQEQLRHILETHGRTADIRALSKIRNPKQRQPMRMGDDLALWVVGS